jgi:hypothetical protein
MSTKKPAERPVHSEEYRGHWIQSALRPIDKRNPISGHEWTEHEVLSTFSVSVQENSPTPTRPAPGWTKMPFRTVKAAKEEVDGQIRLALLVAREAHKAGDKPNGTHFEETWHKAVLAELAEKAKESIGQDAKKGLAP